MSCCLYSNLVITFDLLNVWKLSSPHRLESQFINRASSSDSVISLKLLNEWTYILVAKYSSTNYETNLHRSDQHASADGWPACEYGLSWDFSISLLIDKVEKTRMGQVHRLIELSNKRTHFLTCHPSKSFDELFWGTCAIFCCLEFLIVISLAMPGLNPIACKSNHLV